MLHQLLDWLGRLPPAALYAALAIAATIENFFPPFPADTVVAFGSFAAARGSASVVGTFLATWAGNIAGAMGMYALGRRYGAERLTGRLMKGESAASASARLEALYGRYGVFALALSRFLPGVRALVPPFAGALRIPPLEAGIAMAIPSGIWYAVVTLLAFRVGSDFEALTRRMSALGRNTAIAAAVIVAIGVAVWLVRRRRAR